MTAPVTKARIGIASKILANADAAAVACREANLPYFAACALLEKESGGHNVYGNDKGGALAGFKFDVDESNYLVFEWLVFVKGQLSNGVGPCQITFKPYFREMEQQGLDPWNPHDNCLFGFRILAANYRATGDWEQAFARYNGGPHPNAAAQAYGKDGAKKLTEWKQRLGIK